MDVLDGTKFQEPFGVNQMSYGHFGQDRMSTNLAGLQCNPAPVASSYEQPGWGRTHPFQAISVSDKCYHFLDGMCPDVEMFGDTDSLQSRALVLNISGSHHHG